MGIRKDKPVRRRRQDVMGFTLIELLTTMVVLSILAGIALPRLRGAVLKAEAADVLGDLRVVKVAVMTYQSDQNAWPSEAGPGEVPGGLEDYLPGGFTFRKATYVLDYDNLPGRTESLYNVGVTFIAENRELGLAVMELVGSNIWTDGGTRFTWIIDD